MSGKMLERLEEFYRDDPHDPFNIYALALECMKHDQQRAKTLFQQVINDHPAYIPAYYHAGKLHEQLGDAKGAADLYERGMTCAKNGNDAKAFRELKSAFEELISD